MIFKIIQLVYLILTFFCCSIVSKGLRGYQVLRVENVGQNEIELVTQLVDGYNDEWDPYDSKSLKITSFWKRPSVNGRTDIMVTAKKVKNFKDDLKKLGFKFSVMVKSVQNLIQKEKSIAKKVPKGFGPIEGHSMTWDRYHSTDDFHSYFEYLEGRFPNLFFTETIGKSFEEREMKVGKICKGGCTDSKPAMWIDAGIHASEWIGPATAMFIVKELVENNDAHPLLTEKLDWYILPSVNPDGYAYTRENDTQRLWRKTRSVHSSSQGCVGVDANRNYDFKWSEAGSSSLPCDDQFHGPNAFSEIEIRHVADFLKRHSPLIKFANSLHSYGEMVLLPWSYSNDSRPDGFGKLQDASVDAAEAIYNSHGRRFSVGCIPCLLYPASGASCDWEMGVLNIPYALGMELRDTGKFGMILPPDEILPAAEEIWKFHESFGNLMIEEYMGGDGIVISNNVDDEEDEAEAGQGVAKN